MRNNTLVIITGPTASGKTSLAIKLAKLFGGEIISADSRAIYKDINIASAKPTIKEREGVIHWGFDLVEPGERFTAADFKEYAYEKIEDILDRGKIPFLVGGTGLYVNSLIYNIHYNEVETDLEYRKMLENIDVKDLYKMAEGIDSEALKKIAPTDRKRISRILEIYHSTGKTKTELEKESRYEPEYDYKIFVLNMDRQKLYDRINLRVDLMIKDGLVDEVKQMLEKYSEFPTAMQGLGYKEIVDYLNGNCSLDEAIEKIKLETRRYAKRQLTWFRSYDNATWIESGNPENTDIILNSLK